MISQLFWHKKTLTIGEDGLIRFQINSIIYRFQVYEPIQFYTVQSQRVKIYYDERDMSVIHLFDKDNRFLGTVEPQETYCEEGETIRRHRQKRRAIDQFARDKKKKWDSAQPNKLKSAVFKEKVSDRFFHDFLVDSDDENEKLNLYKNLNNIQAQSDNPILL